MIGNWGKWEEAQEGSGRVGDQTIVDDNSPYGEADEQYGADELPVLEGIEAVRRRPAMYIGGTDSRGLHQLLVEVVDNALDEAVQGECDRIAVTLHGDGSISVSDNGRGFPVSVEKRTGLPGVELALTVLHASLKHDIGPGKAFRGVNSLDLACVNACTEWLSVDVWRDGKHYRARFGRGTITDALKVVGSAKDGHTGTLVHWKADEAIFDESEYDSEVIERYLRELAYLNKDITFTYANVRDHLLSRKAGEPSKPETKVFRSDRGLAELVEHLNATRVPIHEPLYFEGQFGEIFVESAMQYHLEPDETVLPFANMLLMYRNGTHVTGFRTALTRTLNQFARKSSHLKVSDPNFTGSEVRAGLTYAISVRLPNPTFSACVRAELTSPDVVGVVSSIVGRQLCAFLDARPDVAKKILDRIMGSRRAQEANRKHWRLMRDRN